MGPVVRMQPVPDSFVNKQVGTEATRRTQFIKNSTKRIAKGSRNENLYQRQHIAESMRRMSAAQLMDFSRQMTPEGGYWLLDNAAKTHTPDCRAMSNKNWSWETLATVNPASLHSGCRCRIIPALTGARWGRKVPKAVVHELAEADIVELDGVRGVWKTIRGAKVFINMDGVIIKGPKALIGRQESARIREKPANILREGYRWATDEDRAHYKVPDAYTDVIVAQDPKREPRFLGLDLTNKQQPGYSEEWQRARSQEKYARIQRMIEEMPKIDRAIWTRIRSGKDNGDALALAFITVTAMRVGNVKQLGKVPAIGTSTLRKEHLRITGNTIKIEAVTKGGKKFEQTVVAPNLAKALKDALKGKKPTDLVFDTTDARVRKALKEITKSDYKPHDLRTHFATYTALQMVRQMPVPKTDKDRKKQINTVAEYVSSILGNNKAQALKSYIDPSVFDKFGEAL